MNPILYFGDCLAEMNKISDNSVDMILSDLPYGTTSCAWDTIIDLKQLWIQYKRILKPNKAVVMFGSQPFTTTLIYSNIKWYKYSWIWEKNRATGHVHAKNKPMKIHEDICVFSEGNTLHKGQSKNKMPYYPQGLIEMPENIKRRTLKDAGDNAVMGKRKSHRSTIYSHTGYPTSILRYPIEMNKDRFHETQKPLLLLEYLIKTYTVPGELVLDNCMGGGNTGMACINTGRNFIGIENDKNHFQTCVNRIINARHDII